MYINVGVTYIYIFFSIKMSFASTLFSSSIIKETRYDKFLSQMNEIIPWNELIDVIELNHIKSKNNS